MKKTFCIRTFGCKVNQYESQVIREEFLRQGYVEAEVLDKSDVCVINTCTVTSTSDLKSSRLIRNASRKSKCVVATGCLVEGNDMDLSKLKGVGFVIKNKDKYRIPEIVSRDTGHGSCEPKIRNAFGITRFKGHTRAFIKIQDGCNNLCSYCKVRIVRGVSKSRPVEDILKECATLIRNGSKEIVLTGICLGAYGRDFSKKFSLAKLIGEICRIKGEWRLRLSSIEPKDIDRDLLIQLQAQSRLCKHLHIPFQSGDDYILNMMDRPYKRKDYLSIVNRAKTVIPDIAISSDIMVGFPGETEKRFQNTLDFIKTVQPMRLHVFPFSKRKGTKAYNYKDDIPEAIKRRREARLCCIADELTQTFIRRFNEKETEILVEDKKAKDGFLQGYTDNYIKVYIKGTDNLKGQFIKSRLTSVKIHMRHLELNGSMPNPARFIVEYQAIEGLSSYKIVE